MAGKIYVKVFSLKNGYLEVKNLKLVKIISKDYNLAIMEDYLPVIGEVDGNVVLLGDEYEKTYENISGFYKCSKNEFELIIRKGD